MKQFVKEKINSITDQELIAKYQISNTLQEMCKNLNLVYGSSSKLVAERILLLKLKPFPTKISRKSHEKKLEAISDQIFISKFYKSSSIPEFCKKLDFSYGKIVSLLIKERIILLNLPFMQLNPSKFEESMHSEIFVLSPIYRASSTLSKYIRKKNLLLYSCAICSLKEWQHKSIGLELDHINGNSLDNRLENLRFLCPNCHSQTISYCVSKNTLKKRINSLLQDQLHQNL